MVGITDVRLLVDLVVQLWTCFLLSGTAMVSNTINVMVFWRLGFRDSSNISLMVIAVIDCVKCCVGFLHRGYGLAGIFDAALEVNWTRVTYLLNSHVQNFGVPMVSLVTMYLTFERCICMSLPFKVKSLLTTRVTVAVLTVLIFLTLATTSPISMTFYITWAYDPTFNRTVAQYTPTDYYVNHIFIASYISFVYIFWNILSFSVIYICTIVIIVKLAGHAKFRSENLNSGESEKSHRTGTSLLKRSTVVSKDGKSRTRGINKPRHSSLSRRESRLVKMLLLVVLFYCVNILPRLILALARAVEPEFNANRRYHDLYIIAFDLTLLLDLLGANVHIFIYQAMSSQYRATFKLMIFSLREYKR